MKYFLAKTEATAYSIGDLERDGETVWNGVRNPQAVAFIKLMKKGDKVFIYHSTGQSAVVGLAEVVLDAEPDFSAGKDAKGGAKSWTMKIRFLSKFEKPVSLKEIKESGLFGDFKLVYHSRLSTMEVPDGFVKWLEVEKGLKV